MERVLQTLMVVDLYGMAPCYFVLRKRIVSIVSLLVFK